MRNQREPQPSEQKRSGTKVAEDERLLDHSQQTDWSLAVQSTFSTSPASDQQANILRMQSIIGNAATRRLLAGSTHVQRQPLPEEEPNQSLLPPEANASYSPEEPNQSLLPPECDSFYNPEEPNQSLLPDEPNVSYLLVQEPNQSIAPPTLDDGIDFDPAALFPAAVGLAQQDLEALRQVYEAGTKAIKAEADIMLSKGVPVDQVADWANRARNQLKATIRDEGPRIVKRVAEARNAVKYGDTVGPSAEQLRQQGRTNEQIIEGAGRANPNVARWAGRLRIAGRIMIAVDFGIAVYNVATAPEVDRPRVLAQEIGGLAGAIAGGVAGAEAGAALGGGIGAMVGAPAAGVGAVSGGGIGATIGGIVGGIGGAIAGAWGGRELADFAVDQFYPPDQTHFEGDFE